MHMGMTGNPRSSPLISALLCMQQRQRKVAECLCANSLHLWYMMCPKRPHGGGKFNRSNCPLLFCHLHEGTKRRTIVAYLMHQTPITLYRHSAPYLSCCISWRRYKRVAVRQDSFQRSNDIAKVYFILTARSRCYIERWNVTVRVHWVDFVTYPTIVQDLLRKVLPLYTKSECELWIQCFALSWIGTEAAEALLKGKSSMDEPKIGFKYEQQSQQLYSLRDTHGEFNHILHRRTCVLSLTVWSSLPTRQPRCCFTHIQIEILQWLSRVNYNSSTPYHSVHAGYNSLSLRHFDNGLRNKGLPCQNTKCTIMHELQPGVFISLLLRVWWIMLL